MNRTKKTKSLLFLILFLFSSTICLSEGEGETPIEDIKPLPNLSPGLDEQDEFGEDSQFGLLPQNNQNNPNPAQEISPFEPATSIPNSEPPQIVRPQDPPAANNTVNRKTVKKAPLPTLTEKKGSDSKASKSLPQYLDLDPSTKTLIVKSFDLQEREIRDVVTLISKWTGKNFILDSKVRGKITILGPSEVTLQEAYQAFLSALTANNLTTVQLGKFIRIIEAGDARRSPVKTYVGEYSPNDDSFITSIFQLKYINADEVQREFRDMTTRQGKLFAYEPTNSIIITDTGSNIQRIKEILEALDVKSFETTLHLLPIKNNSAKSISTMLSEIYGDPSGSRSGSAARRTFQRSSLERTRGGGIISKIIPDEQTNSLVVLANGAGFASLKKLVERLDIKGGESGKIRVYYCQYAKAEDLATTLSSLASGSSNPRSSSNRQGNAASTLGGTTPPNTRNTTASARTPRGSISAELEGGVKITSDPGTNSLVIVASASDYNTIKDVLSKLDIPRNQVLIETAVLEVTVGDLTNVGVNLGFSTNDRLFGGGSITDGATIDRYALSAGNRFAAPPGGLTIPFKGSLDSLAQYGINTYVGLLNFIATNSESKVLSTPQIVALDNEEAVLKVQDKIPVVTSFNPGTSTSVPQSNVDIREVGIDIKLTPNINAASRTVRLEINQKVDNIKKQAVPEDLAKNQIATTTRETNTTVLVKDTEFVMLGGLMSDKIDETESKVPLLGDIPILGWLFKSKKYDIVKTNLLILLHPTILSSSYDNAKVIEDNFKRREDFIEKNTGGDPFKEDVQTIRDRVASQKAAKDSNPINFKQEEEETTPAETETQTAPEDNSPSEFLPPPEEKHTEQVIDNGQETTEQLEKELKDE